MTVIKYNNGNNDIYNEKGLQAHGSFAAGLEGLNPRELLEASVGLCMSIVMRKILERDNLLKDDTAFKIDVVANKEPNGANRFSNFLVNIDFPEYLEDDYKKKLKVLIENGCTISNTLKNVSAFEIIENDLK